MAVPSMLPRVRSALLSGLHDGHQRLHPPLPRRGLCFSITVESADIHSSCIGLDHVLALYERQSKLTGSTQVTCSTSEVGELSAHSS